MDEKNDGLPAVDDSEAILSAGIENTDSFSAVDEDLPGVVDNVDSYKAFISSPADADADLLVDTLISDATKETESPAIPDEIISEPQEIADPSQNLTETLAPSSEAATTISDEGLAINETANIPETTEILSAPIDTQVLSSSETASVTTDTISKTDTSITSSESEITTVTNSESLSGDFLKNEVPTAVEEESKVESEDIESGPDVLSKTVEDLESEVINSGETESKDATTESTTDTLTDSQQSQPENVLIPEDGEPKPENELVSKVVMIKDDIQDEEDEVPQLRMSDVTSDSTAAEEWKTKDSLCDLEEELKRIHEDDSTEPIIESSLSLHPAVTMAFKEKPGLNGQTITTAPNIPRLEEDTTMKDSDLEEMLSADDVLKDADLIKQSQKDLQTTDLLVCGRCHEVFHFVEEFQSHKIRPCNVSSKVPSICENESKPQVWGFTLWKNKQYRLVKPGSPLPSSWSIYQKWCKLPEGDKKAWISAGQTLQFCNRIGLAKLTEVKPKVVQKQAVIEKDPLALDGFMENNKENSATPIRSLRVNKEIAILPKEKVQDDSNRALRTVKSTETKEYAVEKIVAKRFNPKKKTWEYNIKWEHFPSEENTWEPVANLGHCKRMIDQFEEQLKRLKMEKAKQAANVSKIKVKKDLPITYSPASTSRNMPSSTGRPQRQCKQKALNQVKAWCGNISDDDEGGRSGGLKRSLDEDSDESYEKKMKFEEDSEDSEFETKPVIKMPKKEPITPRGMPVVIKNGIPKGSPIPQNILIPDANGVVRINQKQLPSLSTGVYIMSKTAGIIKLDSTTSKVATSGGQTIVKVAPKIGQTQIKIVKKDGTTTTTQQVIHVNPKAITPSKPVVKTTVTAAAAPKTSTPKPTQPTKIFKPIITKVKKLSDFTSVTPEAKKVVETPKVTAESPKKLIEVKKTLELTPKTMLKPKVEKRASVSEPQTADEDSDDGLEELPFPEDIKIPEPDSPPGDFSLDPFTGKLAGIEYPELPEPEPMEEEKSDDTSLDNIVKLAAADITEDDLKGDPTETPMELEPECILEPRVKEDNNDKEKIKNSPLIIRKADLTPASAAPLTKPIMRVTMSHSPIKRSSSSILNRALTGTTTTQVVRKIVTPASQQRVQQRILNPTISRTTVLNPIIRATNTYSRTRPMAPKPKFNIASPNAPIKMLKPPPPQMVTKNVFTTYTRMSPQPVMTRKIGNTTIRSTPVMSSSKPPARIIQTSGTKYVPKKESLLLKGHLDRRSMALPKAKAKTVISMPSLIGDEDSLSPLVVSEPVTKSSQIHTIMPDEHSEIHMPVLEPQVVNPPPPTVMDPIITSVNEPAAVAGTSNTSQPEQQTTSELGADMSSFTLADSDNPIFITGDDGTVYQVAGQNEQGQTILLTQDANGQQQCLLVTNELAETADTPAEEPQPQMADPVPSISMPEISPEVTEPLQIKTDEDTSDQVVAQVVRAEPPSPGGTHKVVVMLPDGNLMVTQVSPEEYASLELE